VYLHSRAIREERREERGEERGEMREERRGERRGEERGTGPPPPALGSYKSESRLQFIYR